MLKKIWQKSPCFFLSACLFLPTLAHAEASQENVAPQSKPKEQPKSNIIPKDSPWRKLNIFAQLTGLWEKPSKKMDVKSKSNLPTLLWRSEQGGALTLALSPKSPIGIAQKVSIQISGDFFSCQGEPLRLWFSTQQYLDLTKPVCDENNFLNQQSAPEDEKKLALIMNKGGFPVLLSQENSGVIVRSQLSPKEVSAINWYREISNPTVNKELMGEEK